MRFRDFLARTWRDNILFSVSLELTYDCDLRCFFCYNDRKAEGVPLRLEQYLHTLEDLEEMQVMNLVLTGGEPLSHPDFFAIGRHARDLGFVIRVKSNGHALRGVLARRLKQEVDPFIVELSLHGASAQTHDRQTRVPGSFGRLIENIGELKGLGLRLKLNAVLTRWNEHELDAMLGLEGSLGVPIVTCSTVSPRDDGSSEPVSVAPSRVGKLRLFQRLNERARGASAQPDAMPWGLEDGAAGSRAERTEAEKNCGAGSCGLTVDPFGNVLPCVQWRRPVGSLHRESIREIWQNSPALGDVRRLATDAGKVVQKFGPKAEHMFFCPGLAELQTGSPLAVYPSAVEDMELLGDLNPRPVMHCESPPRVRGA